MKAESGRSLIEIIGVMAIAGVMTVSTIGIYRAIRQNQIRAIATSEIDSIAKNVRLLMQVRGTYSGLSVDYLIKAGALKNANAPIGDNNWSVSAGADGKTFSINLTNLSEGECDYFTTAIPKWASAVLVNGYETDPGSHCFSSQTNQISFIAE